MERYQYTVIFEPAEEGGFVAYVPELNGLATQGETLEEAREMVKEAITGYLEVKKKRESSLQTGDYAGFLIQETLLEKEESITIAKVEGSLEEVIEVTLS
jgi:predicted RNase H-like HicB family nuclease